MSIKAKALIDRFYVELWNQADERVADEILHDEVILRRSLEPGRHGRAEFIAYLRSIHAAFGQYRCDIEEVVATETQAAVWLTFSGEHRGLLLGTAPTGRVLQWAGSGFFTIEGDRIRDIKVLADIDSVKAQIGIAEVIPFGG